MIVTRQRKQKKSRLPILLPIAAIAMVVVATSWPPSRNFIVNGPLKPAAGFVIGVWDKVSRPLSFAYQQQEIANRNVEIRSLNDRLESDRKAADAKDAQVQQLQRQIAAVQAEPPPSTPAPVPKPGASAAAAGSTLGGASSAGDVLRRTAQQWSAMDPTKAAGLVRQLPADYVASVFAQMSPDSVGAVLDALPPKVAAGIIQAGGSQISAQSSR